MRCQKQSQRGLKPVSKSATGGSGSQRESVVNLDTPTTRALGAYQQSNTDQQMSFRNR